MRSTSHAPLAADRAADIVIVSIAARGIVAAARRAGLSPIALDLFGDEDTRALAAEAITVRRIGGLAFDADDLLAKLDACAGDLPIVLGAGFEQMPKLVEQIADRFQLVGNSSETLRLLKEPVAFARMLTDLDIPHPRVFTGPAPAGLRTLEKRIGGSGGWHVKPAIKPHSEGWYLQELVEGRSVSAMFLGDGRRARVLGFSEQWCSPTKGSPYRYGGAAGPIEIDSYIVMQIAKGLEGIVGASGLKGLASADIILTSGGWSLIEINPRPGASLDVFDHAPMPPLLQMHLDACDGKLRDVGNVQLSGRAAAILYAPAGLTMQLDPLPDWVADRPLPGAHIKHGDPICTVLGSGEDAAAARAQLNQRTEWLWQALQDADELQPLRGTYS